MKESRNDITVCLQKSAVCLQKFYKCSFLHCRSDQEEHDEALDKSDIKLLLLFKESFKLQNSETEKVNTVLEFMNSNDFKQG